MGQAKRRKEEIEALKQSVASDRATLRGVDPQAYGPEGGLQLARMLADMFEWAKVTGSVDHAVALLHAKVGATTRSFGDVGIECRRGCAHCCHAWVSVSAPEALSVAKLAASRGPEVIARIRAAHDATKAYDFEQRDRHPLPCPMLERGECSIYSARPKACRLAASCAAAVCARSYFDQSDEGIPTPMPYLMARESYAVALALALRKAGLPHRVYEFNGALVRTLDTQDAEQRWLGGEDIFAGVLSEPLDVFDNPGIVRLYEQTFAT